jgi:pilus assembly protein FimV
MGKQRPWPMYALTLVAATVLGAVSPDAYALALGRITVQSALGEPLRAEVEIPQITSEEAASLKATVAPPDAFRAAGLDYNAAMAKLQLELRPITGGKTVLRVSSSSAINEPFVDLILEVTWASGRIVRDYTMLFDPPSLRPLTPPPTVAVIPSAPAPQADPARPAAATAPAVTAAPTISSSPLPPARAAMRPPAPAIRTSAPPPAQNAETKQVTVKAGDTAGRIAAANKPASVSLDQMLSALLQSNPNSFIDGNVNLVKAGAVLDIPTAEQAALLEPGEASRTLVAQSRDFNEFRRKLAQNVSSTPVTATTRQASGKVQAKVEDKKATASAPDKLALSKGSVQSKSAADKIAQERAAKDAAARVAELNKNIAELSKLSTTSSAPAAKTTTAVPTTAVSPAPAASAAPVAAVPAVTVAATAAVPASAEAPAPVPAAAPAAPVVAQTPPAPAPAAVVQPTPPKPPAPTSAPPPEPDLLDQLMENPLIPAGAVGLLALLVGLGVYQSRRRKASAQVDSSFLESRLQPDSFFGASGGQHIDTNEASPTGSSMVYSPSQLDAAGDVDPVAEADVYLAYGRDLQAEEILKEALRVNPKRVAIHGKLLEIYAKRRDAKAFELIAGDAFSLTHGAGPDWERICEQGQGIDPENPLYQPGGQPDPEASSTAQSYAATDAMMLATATHILPTPETPDDSDIDLDLDFSLGDGPDDAAGVAPFVDPQATIPIQVDAMAAFDLNVPASSPEPAPPSPAASVAAMDLDFGLATVAVTPNTAKTSGPSEPEVRLSAPDLTLSENDLSFSTDAFDFPAPTPPPAPVAKAPPAAPTQAPVADAGMIEFDMGSLSLDLDPPAAKAAPTPTAASAFNDSMNSGVSTGFDDSGADPLATKLALAEEFNAIGDPDGARSLAEEVLAEASGALKEKAKRFIAELA